MIKMGLRNKGKKTKTELRLENLLKLRGEKVEVGHFPESGLHYSGMTFPELMKLHATGVPSRNIPSRDVLEILFSNHYDLTKHPDIKKQLSRLIHNAENPRVVVEFLDEVGRILLEEEVDIFGSNQLAPNKAWVADSKPDGNTPLVDTQELVSETSYKNSMTGERVKWR